MVRRKISNPREIVSEVDPNDLYFKLSPRDYSTPKNSAEYNIRNKMMSTNGQHYCLRWNNYQTNMTSVFHQLLQNEAFVDVTLACNDLSLKAHKVVLSACSSYFQKLLLENPCPHPTIIMPADVCFADLKFIIEFVYRGEIDVSQAELQSLLKTADQLKIKGLCEVSDNSTICNNNTDNYPFGFHHGAAEILPSASRRLFTNKYKRSSLQSNFSTSSKKYKLIPNTSKYRIYNNNREQSINNDKELNNETSDKTAKSIKTSEENEDDDVDKNATMPVVILQEDQQAGSTEDTKGGIGGRDATGTFNGQRCDRDGVISPALSDNSVQQPLNMTGHGLIPSQHVVVGDVGEVELPPEPPAPAATPVRPSDILQCEPSHCTTHHDLSETSSSHGDVKVKFETLRSVDANDIDSRLSGAGDNRAGSSMGGGSIDGDDLSQHSHLGSSTSQQMHHTMMITPELLGLIPSSSHTDLNSEQGLKTNGHSMHGHISNGGGHSSHTGTGGGGPKTWSQEDMELALDALRNHNMSLTKASATYGIPSTTLWQRAHRLGIDTPKKEGPTKSWTEDSLNSALEALRTGTISANKASKAYGIPSSTLYKIARREGIRLAAPFNAAPTTWSPEDLERALESIRSGQTSVQRASTEFGIPTGTLYGRCKREGIELSRSNPTPWSEDAMGEALEAVRVGQMSINQAAIHYNLPYSSLYGRFKRGKYETEPVQQHQQSSNDGNSQQQLQISMGGDSSSQDHNMMVAYHHQSPPNNGPQQTEQQYHQYHDIS